MSSGGGGYVWRTGTGVQMSDAELLRAAAPAVAAGTDPVRALVDVWYGEGSPLAGTRPVVLSRLVRNAGVHLDGLATTGPQIAAAMVAEAERLEGL